MAARAWTEEGSLDLVQSTEEDPLLDARLPAQHSLQAHFTPRFQPLPTALTAVLLLLVHVAFVVLAFLTGVLCSYPDPEDDRCPGNYTSPLKVQSVIVLGKVALWLLHLLLERYLQHHHSRARGRGYGRIDRATRPLKTLALLTHSAGNAALLLVLGAQHSFPGHGRLYLALILAVLGLELLGCVIWLLLYAVRIRKFNRAQPQPDVLEEEEIYAHPNGIASETGFRTAGSLEEVVEKQADAIAYLRRHNALLSRRLLALTGSQPGRS
ncbi:PREDICTED: transmembrane protein 192 [Chinchilla lanigera]|uniref:transmembrane protein 192 n=1 Tax=Chinchilla lanigera TaxID=34839 RepID=UPI00069907B7|nr:PREDICTED: transmembrane protein 192 [Chinchilla lanigera]